MLNVLNVGVNTLNISSNDLSDDTNEIRLSQTLISFEQKLNSFSLSLVSNESKETYFEMNAYNVKINVLSVGANAYAVEPMLISFRQKVNAFRSSLISITRIESRFESIMLAFNLKELRLYSTKIIDELDREVLYPKLRYKMLVLPNFTMLLSRLDTIIDQWMYLMKHLGELEGLPKCLDKEYYCVFLSGLIICIKRMRDR